MMPVTRDQEEAIQALFSLSGNTHPKLPQDNVCGTYVCGTFGCTLPDLHRGLHNFVIDSRRCQPVKGVPVAAATVNGTVLHRYKTVDTKCVMTNVTQIIDPTGELPPQILPSRLVRRWWEGKPKKGKSRKNGMWFHGQITKVKTVKTYGLNGYTVHHAYHILYDDGDEEWDLSPLEESNRQPER
jgi:hypothetical protein